VIRRIVEVDPARRAQWLMPSAMRRVHPREIRYLLPVRAGDGWEQGDLLLCEVLGSVGRISSIQNTNRRSLLDFRDASLFPGTKLVAVLAPRAGASTCVARVPDGPVPELHLHGVGGQAGAIVPGSENSVLYRGSPTTVKVLARLGGVDGRPLNMRRFGVPVSPEPRARTAADPALVLVLGSDMDAGKTATARRMIYSFTAMGRPVVAGKATGVGSLMDIASMFDAGASEVFDFSDLGEPVTIGLAREDVLSLFHRIFNHLRGKVGADGFVVLELADGIWYRETRFLLEDERVRDLVTHVVFACHSILDAERGVELLGQLGYGNRLAALSGRLGSSGVLRDIAKERFEDHPPVFDALDYASSPEAVLALFERQDLVPSPPFGGGREPRRRRRFGADFGR
jgi:hypothetical protein